MHDEILKLILCTCSYVHSGNLKTINLHIAEGSPLIEIN